MTRTTHSKRTPRGLLGFSLLIALLLGWAPAKAADHGDAPLISNDQGADIADVYAFLDPNDNDFLVTIITARGFIVPGEAENMGFFQDHLNWRFAIETSGDAEPDASAEVTFSSRTSPFDPQIANITLRQGSTPIAAFAAPTTTSSATAPVPPPFVVTTDPSSGISAFAGMVDDPFFFDVPAELLFRESLLTSPPPANDGEVAPGANPGAFDRGRDTFAGYNVMSVALRIPLSIIGATSNTFLGVSGYTEPTQFTKRSPAAGVRNVGQPVNVDRMGIPGINTVLMPYPRKDGYNRGSTLQDANGDYFSDLTSSLRELKTGSANTNTLVNLVVPNGDFLRLDTTIRNTGPQGGLTAGAGFPNGRRLADDPIDIIVNIISNQLFDAPGSNGVVDNVSQNDAAFSDGFPFLAPPHQPRPEGTLDDGTRN